jgi:serine/threonine protein kinase
MNKISRYKVLDEIGRGSMGVVYRAHDPSLDRLVAIKVIEIEIGASPAEKKTFLDRFLLEARSAGRLSHPNIVTVHDVGVDQQPYIVMEFFPGRNLSALLEAGRPDFDVTRKIGIQLADALRYAHEHGVVHRDVKLANVIYLPGPRTKLVDFGIARSGISELTSTGELLGTPHYMSPEAFTGATVDSRSDLFSLGVILYQLLTGYRPFDADTIERTVYQILNEDPRPPRQIDRNIPEPWDAITARLLAKDPGARYQDGNVLVADLDRLGSTSIGLQVADKTVALGHRHRWRSLLSRLRLPGRRKLSVRLLRAIIAIGILLMAGLGAVQLSSAVELERFKQTLPLTLEAKHDHRIGSCSGVLTLAVDHIGFASDEHGKWRWSFGEVRGARRASKWKLQVTTNESEILRAGSSKHYNFSLLNDGVDDRCWTRYLKLMDLEPSVD